MFATVVLVVIECALFLSVLALHLYESGMLARLLVAPTPASPFLPA